jgi:Kelch motif
MGAIKMRLFYRIVLSFGLLSLVVSFQNCGPRFSSIDPASSSSLSQLSVAPTPFYPGPGFTPTPTPTASPTPTPLYALVNSWAASTLADGAPIPRFDHTAVWASNQMIVWGGLLTRATVLNSGGRYNLASNSWLPTSLVAAPMPRLNHSAIWTGSKMIVWGGLGANNTILGDGGMYEPTSDTWVAVNPVGAPSPRHAHTAVWTGTKMIVWGGSSTPGTYTAVEGAPLLSTTPMGDGAIFDPATNSWAPLNLSQAPTSRSFHASVIVGNSMIIWGGQDSGGSEMNTGGVYNLTTGTWSSISSVNAPIGRINWHRGYNFATGTFAYAAGSKMLVWGGSIKDKTVLKGGAIYDPALNSWTTISTVGAPTNLQNQTAVWTGTKLIAYGGWFYAAGQSIGGIFDLATNSWSPINSTGAPAATKWGMSAVWSGAGMILWGGVVGNIYATPSVYNTGGIYY